jgi:rhodanese-related sulfurtransferase
MRSHLGTPRPARSPDLDDNPLVASLEPRAPATVDELLAEARAKLARLTAAEAMAAVGSGAAIVDIRPTEQRQRDGRIPGAHVIPRNVLEWRLDPSSEHRDPTVALAGRRVIVVCDEGYQSSLAAATLQRLGLDATDVIGGVQSWRAEGLPLEASGPAA